MDILTRLLRYEEKFNLKRFISKAKKSSLEVSVYPQEIFDEGCPDLPSLQIVFESGRKKFLYDLGYSFNRCGSNLKDVIIDKTNELKKMERDARKIGSLISKHGLSLKYSF